MSLVIHEGMVRRFWDSKVSPHLVEAQLPDPIISLIKEYIPKSDLTESITLESSGLSPREWCHLALGKEKGAPWPRLPDYQKIRELLSEGVDLFAPQPFEGQDRFWERVKLLSGADNSISHSFKQQQDRIDEVWRDLQRFQPDYLQEPQLNAAYDKLEAAQTRLRKAYQTVKSPLKNTACAIISFFLGWAFRWWYGLIDIERKCELSREVEVLPIGRISIPAEGDGGASEKSYVIRARLDDIDWTVNLPAGARSKPKKVVFSFVNADTGTSGPIVRMTVHYIRRGWQREHSLLVRWLTDFYGSSKQTDKFVEKVIQFMVEILLKNKDCDLLRCDTVYSSFLMTAAGGNETGGNAKDAEDRCREILSWRTFGSETANMSEEQIRGIDKEPRTSQAIKIVDCAKFILQKMKGSHQKVTGNALVKLWKKVKKGHYPLRERGMSGYLFHRDYLRNEALVYFSGEVEPWRKWPDIIKANPILEKDDGFLPLGIMKAEN